MTGKTVEHLALTPREIEIIEYLAEGLSFPEIGEQMGISVRTVKSYSDSARKKLNAPKARLLPSAYQAATGASPWPEVTA
jgi:DNA-binding NarL/FixJ family response regulator